MFKRKVQILASTVLAFLFLISVISVRPTFAQDPTAQLTVTPADVVIAGESITVGWDVTSTADSLYLSVIYHFSTHSAPNTTSLVGSGGRFVGEETFDTFSGEDKLWDIDIAIHTDEDPFIASSIAEQRLSVHCRYLWFMLPVYDSQFPPNNAPAGDRCPGRPLLSQATHQPFENGFTVLVAATGELITRIDDGANELGQMTSAPISYETVQQTVIDGAGPPYLRLHDGSVLYDNDQIYDGWANPNSGFRPGLSDSPAPSSPVPQPPTDDVPCPASGVWPAGCNPNLPPSPAPTPQPPMGNDVPCPASGVWPAGCNPNLPPAPPTGDCVIPPSGPWPPCATAGDPPPPDLSGNCVIPPSGPWPVCASGGSDIPTDRSEWAVLEAHAIRKYEV